MKRIISTLAALFLCLSVNAQTAVVTSGGDASGSGGSVSFSVGQIVYSAVNGSGGSLIQGVQQPYEISISTGSPETPGISLAYSVYPNPTSDILTLSIDNFEKADLVYQLYDVDGKVIDTQNIKRSKTSIDMRFLTQAIYFLRVSEKVSRGSNAVKIFKIIKR